MRKLKMSVETVTGKKPSRHLELTHKDNPGVRGFLDVISQNMANEFIETARKNPEVFQNTEETK